MAPPSDEFAYIDHVRRRAGTHPRVPLGIGDDAALVRFPEAAECLVAADMLLEGVHFTMPPVSPRNVGRKALGVNLSDMAAMAGTPLAAFVSVAFPRDRVRELCGEFDEGLRELAAVYEVAVAGGDTNTWNGPLVVDVTLLGEAPATGPVRRSGAQPGDWILATGRFGGSLSSGRHCSFEPRVREAQILNNAAALHAMIDVSDGLAADLHHILEESSVGAVLYADRIPISEAVAELADGKSALEHALTDGEDFELLLTVSPQDGRRLLEQPPVEVLLSHVGEIVPDNGLQIEDAAGNRSPLAPHGWQHGFGTEKP